MNAESFKRTLIALGLDPKLATDGWRTRHPFPVAVSLAILGFKVLPTRVKNKAPFLTGWPERATTDPAKLVFWQARFSPLWRALTGRKNKSIAPDADNDLACLRSEFNPNWSVLTGRENNLIVLDIDGEQGRADLAQLESQFGPLPDTWRCNSGRIDGGFHVWVRPPPGTDDIRNRQPILGTKIDVRGYHGQIVVSGSLHGQSGNRYAWAEGCAPDEIELAECPALWWEFLKKESAPASTRSRSQTRSARHGSPVKQKHDRESRLIGDGIGEGGFNRPIRSRCCQFFKRFGPDADPSRFKHVLRQAILNANSANHTPDQIARYASDDYINAELASARKWIITQENA